MLALDVVSFYQYVCLFELSLTPRRVFRITSISDSTKRINFISISYFSMEQFLYRIEKVQCSIAFNQSCSKGLFSEFK